VALNVKCKDIDVVGHFCTLEEQNKDKTWNTVAELANIGGDFKKVNMTFYFEK